MSRGLNAGFLTALRGEDPSFFAIFDIATGYAATPTLRYCMRPDAFTWGGNVYSPRGIEVDEIRVEGHQQASGAVLTINDVDRVLVTLLEAGAPFMRQVVVCRTVEVTDASNAMRNDLVVDGVRTEFGKFELLLKPFTSLMRQPFPKTTKTPAEFPGIPKGIRF